MTSPPPSIGDTIDTMRRATALIKNLRAQNEELFESLDYVVSTPGQCAAKNAKAVLKKYLENPL